MQEKTYMKPQEVKDWLAFLNINCVAAGRLIGKSHKTIYRYRNGEAPVPKETALAMHAVAAGLHDRIHGQPFRPFRG